MGKPRTLHVNGISYNLDKRSLSDIANDLDSMGRKVHIVRIMDNWGNEITNARIWGTQDETDIFASKWTNDLLRANPRTPLKYTILELAYDSVVREEIRQTAW
jgi:hypothetical protein